MEKALIDAQQAVVTHSQAAIIAEPGVGAFDFPAASVAPELASVIEGLLLFVPTVGSNQLDTALLQPPPQRIAVIALVGNDPRRFGAWPSAWSRNFHARQRGFGERDLVRRGRRQECSQRNTLAVDQYHPLRALAALGFPDRSAPFLAGAKLPSRNVSSQCNRPRWSSVPSKARQASSQMSRSSQSRNRRQQVTPLGYRRGRSRHRAPVRNTQSMPSKQARFSAQGRPLRSRRTLGSGSKFLIFSHCSLLSMMGTVNLNAGSPQKYLS
jgi:hypothetical protein